MYLYEELDTLRKTKHIIGVPEYIKSNLNMKFELREYQVKAFENFITYFENDTLRRKPTNILFHMATGSGKTIIMSGLIIYLYKKGYRNFLFFVNSDNIVNKTKINFLDSSSSKYLFSDEINIEGKTIKINEVSNFQNTYNDDINICFTTIQGLHSDLNTTKENNVSYDDFKDKRIVLISDEAHHLNVDTKNRLTKEEENLKNSWEYTVGRIFDSNNENVMLEFTATCDIENKNIKEKYEKRMVYDYPLNKFRLEGYSKEIKTFRTDLDIMERSILAMLLSQYRLKLFNDNKLNIKPVILFKSDTIENSKSNQKKLLSIVEKLDGKELERIIDLVNSDLISKLKNYLSKNNITYDMLAQELKDNFNIETTLNTNDVKNESNMQILLNSLEDKSNPYRAIFTVNKLNEGWDVLNLFDIVRLYETRQDGGKKSKVTITEAQLIGRGARYCPFKINDTDTLYKRKFDNDVGNDLRICEELYYHCQNDSRYITELHQALREIGIDLKNTIDREYILKDSFKSEKLYKEGIIFKNKRVKKSREKVNGLKSSLRDKIYTIHLERGNLIEDTILENIEKRDIKLKRDFIRIKNIATSNYSLVNKVICKYPLFKFNILKEYYPNLKSTREFIISDDYLGNIQLEILYNSTNLSKQDKFNALLLVLDEISNEIYKTQDIYEGTKEFTPEYISNIFKNKILHFTNVIDGGLGTSQNDNTVDSNIRTDLLEKDWYVYNDNYGTSEEKAFISYFSKYIDVLRNKYDKVFLLRNERYLAIYDFEHGERFEPDYILLLQKNNNHAIEQLQIFIEPKGAHLLEKDKWKEDFLLKLEKEAIITKKFVDDNKYRIWGFNFFNREKKSAEFRSDMQKLIEFK